MLPVTELESGLSASIVARDTLCDVQIDAHEDLVFDCIVIYFNLLEGTQVLGEPPVVGECVQVETSMLVQSKQSEVIVQADVATIEQPGGTDMQMKALDDGNGH